MQHVQIMQLRNGDQSQTALHYMSNPAIMRNVANKKIDVKTVTEHTYLESYLNYTFEVSFSDSSNSSNDHSLSFSSTLGSSCRSLRGFFCPLPTDNSSLSEVGGLNVTSVYMTLSFELITIVEGRPLGGLSATRLSHLSSGCVSLTSGLAFNHVNLNPWIVK